jgi:hypothetical protein
MKTSHSLTLALALSIAACSDPSGPGGSTRPITVNLCSGLAPGVWFAYQNEGGAWTKITPNSAGEISFDATEKVSVASAIDLFGLTFTEILNATATELEATGDVLCEGDFGTKTMSGSVAGLGAEQFARIGAAGSSAGASLSSPTWLLEDLPNHPVDLLATSYATFSSQPAQRVIVRRGITPNGSVAPLDFAGTEAVTMESSVATFTNIMANGSLTMLSAVRTANGTTHELGDLTNSGEVGAPTQAVGYVSLPASLRIATDIHEISAAASNSIATNTIVHYYNAPSAKTLAFGPIVNEPTITNTTTSGIIRPRIQLVSQAEYPSATVVQLGEAVDQVSRYVGIVTTAGFMGGTPATWDVTVPDMSTAGYQASWGLQTQTYNWSVAAYGSSGAGWPLGTVPVNGVTVISGTRGKVDVVQINGPASRLIPRLMARMR